MSAPRAYQFIALRRLAAVGGRRQLHMSGPATFPSPLFTAERPVSNLPRDIAGLRAECERRKLSVSGSMQELVGRLSADNLTHSRAFTSAVNADRRPTTEQKDEVKVVRHFNTSRALKTVKDSSTVDFAYLPDLNHDMVEVTPVRVPLLHHNFSPIRTGAHGPEAADEMVMKPEIHSLVADKIITNFSEATDNNAMHIDVGAMAQQVSAATQQQAVKAPVADEQSSILKELWKGIVQDVQEIEAKSRAA